MKNFLVRLAREDDSKNIFDWRNDTLTRDMSHTNKIVSWQQHTKWFDKSLVSKNRKIVICEYNIIDKIAVVRFDTCKSGVLISINLNPNKRGKNLGKFCLMRSIEFFLKKYPSTEKFFAEVFEENIASKKIFLGAGFEKYKVENHIGYYSKNLI